MFACFLVLHELHTLILGNTRKKKRGKIEKNKRDRERNYTLLFVHNSQKISLYSIFVPLVFHLVHFDYKLENLYTLVLLMHVIG